MRSRNIKPGFFLNEELAECEPLARILFAGLWCLSDRLGRFQWKPKRMKIQILPYDSTDINDLLEQLISHGLIKQYNIDGHDYGLVKGFLTHQKPHHKEKESTIPPPKNADTYQGTSEHLPGQVEARLIPDSLNLIHKDRKAPTKKEKPSEHFSIPSGKELEQRLKTAGQKIEAKTDRKNFRPFQWVQKMFILKYHPLAITEIIEYLAEHWNTVEKPYPFGESALKIRSGNYYAKDHETEAKVEKGLFDDLVQKLAGALK